MALTITAFGALHLLNLCEKLRKEVNFLRRRLRTASERNRLVWETTRTNDFQGITIYQLEKIWEKTDPPEEKVSP